ncbi:MAG: mandelate racemase/muconate lactonizing enzyme family protein [Pseudomonadota bacterium]
MIKRISVFAHTLEVVNGPYVFSGGTLGALTTYLVKIEGDNGHSGWGETCPLGPTYQPAHALGAEAGLRELAPILVGAEATPRAAMALMNRSLDGHNYVKAAFEIALYDLVGKAAGLPVSTLLGGALRDRIPSYYAISLMDPEPTAEVVREKQREGYRGLQIKIGSGDVMKDAEVLHAAWDACAPGVTLAADANRAMTVDETIQLSQQVSDVPVAFEQPVRTMEEVASLKGRLNHALYLDEATVDVAAVQHAFGNDLCDGLGMKITRVGGLGNMAAIRDMAAARRAKISVDDSWGGDVIAAACVHMGATVDPRLFRGTWLAAPYIDHHYDHEHGIEIKDGHIAAPSLPGLGVTPDEAIFGDPILEV